MEELLQVKKVTIAQDGDQFIKDQALIAEALETIQKLKAERQEILKAANTFRKEVDRLTTESLKKSTEFEELRQKFSSTRAKLATSNIHLFKFLDETEARFDNTSAFDSPEICRDYMDAASFTAKYFQRTNNRFNEAKHWYDNYSLNF
jgi:phage shock protein A